MKSFLIRSLFLCISALSLYGCGGGGGSGSPTPTTSTPTPTTPIVTQTTKISGTASAAPVSGGNVTVYKVVNGVKDVSVGTGTTGSDGKYTVDIGTYTGPVIVEISGGSYTDEATGATRSIPGTSPMHAVLANATGTVTSAVTPLTELAYQLAGTNLTTTAITTANKTVGDMFKVSDIINSQPVAPAAADLNALSQSNLSQKDQYNYTLALAALSQLSADLNKNIAGTVDYLKTNTAGTSLNTTAATAFQSSVATFFVPAATNSNNKTGVTDPTTTVLATIGGKKAILKLSTSGTLPAGISIKGISVNITLPTGATVKSDSTTGVLSSYLYLSGAFVSSSTSISSNFASNTNTVTISAARSDAGVNAPGEFATLECDIAYNATTPTQNSFQIPSYKVTGLLNGNSENLNSTISIIPSLTIK